MQCAAPLFDGAFAQNTNPPPSILASPAPAASGEASTPPDIHPTNFQGTLEFAGSRKPEEAATPNVRGVVERLVWDQEVARSNLATPLRVDFIWDEWKHKKQTLLDVAVLPAG
jgi:hypothetical protein